MFIFLFIIIYSFLFNAGPTWRAVFITEMVILFKHVITVTIFVRARAVLRTERQLFTPLSCFVTNENNKLKKEKKNSLYLPFPKGTHDK